MTVYRSKVVRFAARSLLAALVCWSAAARAVADEKTPATESASAPGDDAKPKADQVDPRFRTPKATVRWFLASINAAEDNPNRIKDAVACLDLSQLPPSLKNEGGRLAFELERILRWLKLQTSLIDDLPEGTTFTVPGKPEELSVTLRRQPDGRWLFDGKTVAALPKMGVTLYRQVLETPPPKDESEVPGEFQTPQTMYRMFVETTKRNNYEAAAKCLDLSGIEAPARYSVGRELAVKLRQILDRTKFVLYQDVPNTSLGEPLEAVIRPEGRIVVERQTTGERKGQWLFNQATVESIDRLFDAYEHEPIVPELKLLGEVDQPMAFGHSHGLWLRERVPNWLQGRINVTRRISVRIYQLFGLALLVALILPLYHFVVRVATRLAQRLVAWREGAEPATLPPGGAGQASPPAEAENQLERIMAWTRPLACAVAIALLVRGVQFLDLDQRPAALLLSALVPLDWLVGTFFLFQLVDPAIRFVVGRHATRPGSMTRAAMGFPVISLVLKFLVIGLGLSEVLELFSFDVTTVLAGLGIGGLAFALAAQDTLKNFFGSIMLIWDRTFRVGDLVQIGTHEGLIESVGLRTTRIRGLDDSLLTIPNSDLTTEHVTNYGARRYRRFRTSVGVPYGTPLEQIVHFRDAVAEVVRRDRRIVPDRSVVVVNDLGFASIDVLVEVFFDVADEREELKARDAVILEILRLSEQFGITPQAQGKTHG